ncbi:MAG: hypothetical protein HUU30_13585 [Burkholderiaceae bacterium]|nr:hypothetical protein [Burkholderiaceae bacterium]
MKSPKWTLLPPAAAIAMALSAPVTAAAPVAAAQTATHEHAAATPHKLTLNQGRKWTTDEPLRAGMGRIRSLVEPQLAAAHADKLTPAQYRELATQVETEVGAIVANCKLEPEADAMLHRVIADLSAATDTMSGNNAQVRPALGLVNVAEAVNQYGSHFDHPDFTPIRNVH